MGLSRDELSETFTKTLEAQDVALLNEHGHNDDTLALLATEHAARCQALVRCIDPTFASRLFLILANAFSKDSRVCHEFAVANA